MELRARTRPPIFGRDTNSAITAELISLHLCVLPFGSYSLSKTVYEPLYRGLGCSG